MKIKFLSVLLSVAALPLVAQITPGSKALSFPNGQEFALPISLKAKSVGLQLDSIIQRTANGDLLSKVGHTYESGKDHLVTYTWNSTTNAWDPMSKAITTLDANGNMLSQENLSWNTTDQQWANNSKVVITYHNERWVASTEMYRWNKTTSGWVGMQKYSYVYNSNNQITENIVSTWDSQANEWVGMMKGVMTYDQNNRLILEESFMMEGNDWVQDYKVENTYEGDKRIVIASFVEDGKGVPDEKREQTLDANGNPTLSLTYLWNEETAQWPAQAKYKEVKAFDSNNNTLLIEQYDWIDDSWVGSNTKYVHEYDANGNLLLKEEHTWDEMNKVWEASRKNTKTFNAEGYQTLESDFVWNGNDWQSDKVATFHYSVPTSINEASANKVYVYVVDGRIEAVNSTEKIEIYNVQGAKVANSNLAKGLYLVRLGDVSTKLVVK